MNGDFSYMLWRRTYRRMLLVVFISVPVQQLVLDCDFAIAYRKQFHGIHILLRQVVFGSNSR